MPRQIIDLLRAAIEQDMPEPLSVLSRSREARPGPGKRNSNHRVMHDLVDRKHPFGVEVEFAALAFLGIVLPELQAP